MPDTASHERIIAEIATLQEAGRHRDTQVASLQNAVSDVKAALNNGQVRFTKIEGTQEAHGELLVEIRNSITTAVRDGLHARDRHDERILALEADKTARDAERSLIARIVASKPFLWLASMVTAAAAFLWRSGGSHAQ